MTKNSLARTHGRHLVGGRAPILAADEHLINFDFAEKAGALRQFIKDVSKWPTTLWSYRNFGSDTCRVLVGFHVLPGKNEAYEAFLKSLPAHYKPSEETGNPMFKLFLSGKSPSFRRADMKVDESANKQ
jgi:threonine dehydratase